MDACGLKIGISLALRRLQDVYKMVFVFLNEQNFKILKFSFQIDNASPLNVHTLRK